MKTPSSEEPSSGPENPSGTCPSCGGEIPADAPDGLCPACLAAAAAETLPAAGGDSNPRFTAPEVGELNALLPDFEVIELIGRGGMGAVYKARQIKLNRQVAIKVLPESIAADAAFAERFTREAHALAQLSHPNIVTVHDVGSAGELVYIVMEHVDGANLRQVLESGNLAPKEALAIVVQICDALQYAHDAGIVHRDIKPENILITEKGAVKIADFGLVKLIGGESPEFEVTLTATHQAMGTLQYMAPEQLSGSADADHRADIYSLGVVFYEMLTGEIPAGRFDPPSQRVSVDVRLDEVVLRALDGQPERRYQNAGEIRTEVETISGTQQRETPPSGATTGAPAGSRTADQTPRFSKSAIVGALWAPFFFVAFLSMFMLSSASVVHESDAPPQSGMTFFNYLMLLFVALPGITAPIGTTVLGMVSINRIRHSGGRITGLPLALADALLFPLLILDGLLFFASHLLISLMTGSAANHPVDYQMIATALLGLILCAIVDFLIVRAAWRAAKAPPSAV